MASKTVIGSFVRRWVLSKLGIRGRHQDKIHRCGPHPLEHGFHLVNNLREAVEAFLPTQRVALQAAAALTVQALTAVAGSVSPPRRYRGRRRGSQGWQQRQEAAQQQRHATWVTTSEALHPLHAQGPPVATIAQHLGLSRPTV